jgi:hypothetical protein
MQINKKFNLTLLFAVFATIVSLTAYSQQSNQTKIIGTWTFSKFDFLKPDSDSLDLIEDAMGPRLLLRKGISIRPKKLSGTILRILNPVYIPSVRMERPSLSKENKEKLLR